MLMAESKELKTLLMKVQEESEKVQVRCMIQDAQGWCTGMTQRNGMRREAEGAFRIVNTCAPVADSC